MFPLRRFGTDEGEPVRGMSCCKWSIRESECDDGKRITMSLFVVKYWFIELA
jgi:hypothetical protein